MYKHYFSGELFNMQRKNNILKTPCLHRSSASQTRNKRGFAIIMAMSVIVIIGTVMALSLALTNKTTKQTADLYVYEQAVLLSKSAAEYALLRISQATPCSISNLSFSPPSPLDYYDITVDMRYVYDSAAICTNGGATSYFVISTPESNGSVLMDITVEVDDATIVSEPVRYFRRSIQKL